MKRSITFIIGLLCACMAIGQLPSPPSGMIGESLQSWLKANWFDDYHNQLGYTVARRKMYNYIDNHNDSIRDVYSGYLIYWPYGGSGTNPQPINCEHTVPQSYFAYYEPMKSDLHHLFPVHGSVNSSRSNNPFAEINDLLTSKWWGNGSSQTTLPTSGIDGFSEYHAGTFEPREDHKGNAARAVFYFYTMYPTQGGDISQLGDIQTLYNWHLADPVDVDEIIRNAAIESFQGDRNPYIDHPELVAQAWGFTSPSTDLFFSEYVEGSSYNKAIEIVNLTGSPVDLSNYSLKKQTNGGGNWTSGLTLSGTLAHGETYVIAHNSASSGLSQQADLLTTNSSLSFNGNDPVALFHNGGLVDIIGDFNGGTNYFASNTTLRRKLSITEANTSYTTSEWDQFASNTFSDIGQYGTPKTISATTLESAIVVSAFPNPFSEQLQIQLTGDWKEDLQAEIINVQGQQLWAGQLDAGENLMIDTQEFAAGMYLLQISDGMQMVHKRIVKN